MHFSCMPTKYEGVGMIVYIRKFLNKGLTVFRISQWRRPGASIMIYQGNISKRRRRTKNSSKRQG